MEVGNRVSGVGVTVADFDFDTVGRAVFIDEPGLPGFSVIICLFDFIDIYVEGLCVLDHGPVDLQDHHLEILSAKSVPL